MVAFRLLLILIFLFGCDDTFASVAKYVSSTTYIHQPSDSTVHFGKKGIPLFAENSVTESFLPEYEAPWPKMPFGFNSVKSPFLYARNSKVDLLYIVFSATIGLSLERFAISYPFHSFP